MTGGGRNIGRAIAIALAEGGAAVVVNVRTTLRKPRRSWARSSRRRQGARQHADVTDGAAVKRCSRTRHALRGVDMLVNNAAVRDETPFDEMTWNVARGHRHHSGRRLQLHQACLPSRASEAAAIVNIGGLSAHTGASGRPHAVAAKPGLVGFTRALAHELAGDRIRVNTVTPGLMAAPRPHSPAKPQHHSLVHALVGRRGQPDDIASAVRFICGPGAADISGFYDR